MKPLTIDELKSLEVGDWVWLVYNNTDYRRYAQIQAIEGTRLYVWGRGLAECEMKQYSDYGKTWLAYKNKEEAESKGEIVERELWEQKFDTLANDVWCIIYNENEEIKIRKERCLSATYDGIFTVPLTQKGKENFYKDGFWFTTIKEAKRRLAELKGEIE